MTKDKELYRILELDESATESQIADSYQRLGALLQDGSKEKRRLDFAYSILSDIEKRARYDITGKTGTAPAAVRRASRPGRTDRIRTTLNTLFLAGAAVTTILFILQYCGITGTAPFYAACGISLLLKITEYILRLIP